jgi:hypothetical protein
MVCHDTLPSLPFALQVVFNMKKLRGMTVEGNKLKVNRYRPVVKLGDNEVSLLITERQLRL